MPLVLAAAFLLPALSAAPLWQAQQETEIVNETVALPSGGTLDLQNFSGDVRITAGSGNDVVIKAVRRAPRERLDHIALDITTDGSTVTINANARDAEWEDHDNNVVETEFEIQVPARANLKVSVFSSDVIIAGVTGTQELKTFSGDLTVSGASGSVVAKTFNGDVDIDLTDAGTTPNLTVETFSGSIDADVADNARGTITFNSFSGDLESDLDLTITRTTRRSTTADLPGGSGDTIKLKTFSADATIR
jgi:DUF4097 and DUF4098 domain-containing protein YvlB